MASPRILVLLPLMMLSTIRLLPMVGNGLHEATGFHMQQRAELQKMEITGLLDEVEERSLEETKPSLEEMEPSVEEKAVILEESDFSWGVLLFATSSKLCQCCLVVVDLVALLGLCLRLWKRISPLLPAMALTGVLLLLLLSIIWLTVMVGYGWLAWEDLLFAAFKFSAVAGYLVLLIRLSAWLKKRTHAPDRSKEQERSSSSTGEAESSSNTGEAESSSNMGEAEEEEREVGDYVERLVRDKVRRSARSVAYRRKAVEKLVGDLLGALQKRLSESFFPVLQPAIGVGSAFEGWSPRGHDAVYTLLVPLKPPRGHAFHLELGTARDAPEKHRVQKHRVRVELVCTCTKDTRVGDMLCFVHQPYEALQRNQDSSLVNELCTGRYLDAQKIARWIQGLVTSAWEELPHSRRYGLRLLPSRRSCKLELTSASGRSLRVEMLFGVQRGHSDLFLSSQAPEAVFTPGTMWAESFAVAEAKFFSHVARQAPPDSVHLQCLQLCASSLAGTVLSSDILKTVVMDLLSLIHVTSWMGPVFVIRLQDVMAYLRSCLLEKRLDHFIIGNKFLPEDILLAPDTREAEPLNLFQCLAEDAQAYAKALGEFEELQDQLKDLLLFKV
ncbi:PREDICTED: inositol 1,4,5-trisphosphate receptor-interacting protein-like 1 [Calidris pugnax]|uniref:inositol 1,4,5-trisphosphate receptor-interacting protein-like 1 n=1 Tax=Calidris pugnax TaxID=198806 RepID=UPI00071E28D0|nr:PREDICTED: inositol 1,4,5-trisphosphate receptor-interacting protein-like 1 [Calidris pugnax]